MILAAATILAAAGGAPCAVYRDSNPRLVACVVDSGHSLELQMTEVSAGGSRSRPLASEALAESSFTAIATRDLFHDGRPQIVVTMESLTSIYSWDGRDLDEIGELSTYRGLLAVDLDHDGVPELLSTDCCRAGICSEGVDVDVQHYDGDEFQSINDRYLDMASFTVGEPAEEWKPALPAPANRTHSEGFVLYFVNGEKETSTRVKSAVVRLDGKRLPVRINAHTGMIELPIELGEKCHTITADVTGPAGATLWVFLREDANP